MPTIEIDEETYSELDALAKLEHSSVGMLIKQALRQRAVLQRSIVLSSSGKTPHGYVLPVSVGSRRFTSEDVQNLEEKNDRRGIN